MILWFFSRIKTTTLILIQNYERQSSDIKANLVKNKNLEEIKLEISEKIYAKKAGGYILTFLSMNIVEIYYKFCWGGRKFKFVDANLSKLFTIFLVLQVKVDYLSYCNMRLIPQGLLRGGFLSNNTSE